jgi:hypothetical protein
MVTVERCIEALAFCHLQDESRWAAARVLVQQDIDAYVQNAGPGLAEKRDALRSLMARFVELFPDEGADPVLVRSYIRRQLRKIEYDLQRGEQSANPPEDTEETAPDERGQMPPATPGQPAAGGTTDLRADDTSEQTRSPDTEG